MSRGAAVIAACLLAAVPTAALVRPASDRQVRTIELPESRTLSLEVTIGDIEIRGEDRRDASLEVIRHAPTEKDVARMPIDIDESASHVAIRAVQPNGATNAALRTDVTLRVPRGSHLSLVRLLEGDLRIADLAGAIDANVQRGSIEAKDVSGAIRLEAGIGDVVVTRATLVASGVLRLRAFNGDVRLSLTERPADARIMALALNGTITSDIPLAVRDTWGPRWAETTLGKGHPVISIDVVTGKIAIDTP